MGLSTYSELLNTLLERQPDQWITVLENIEPKLSTHGFTSLIDFVTSDVGKGGLGMDKKQLVHLLRYNPVYKHKADHLEGKMGLCEYAKGVGVLGEHGVRHYETENVISKQGNSSDYRIAKLKRDHPVVADRYRFKLPYPFLGTG